jgi:hypothetical protein
MRRPVYLMRGVDKHGGNDFLSIDDYLSAAAE